jgi:tyrosine-protein phosphatase SIW14
MKPASRGIRRYKRKPIMKTFRYSALSLALIAIPAFSANLQVSGVPNFHQVNDRIYRGGQPSNEAWQGLAKLGVKTVIDLRREDEHPTVAEARAVEAAGMRYVNIPMKGIVAPTDEQITKVLALFESGPVFVHCRRGADRTGTVVACYRMRHDGWDNHKAFKEAKTLGMSWMEFGMKQYIMAYRAPVDHGVAGEVATAATDAQQPTPALP